MLCECFYRQFGKRAKCDRAYNLHILPLWVIHLFPRDCTNYLTRLEKVRLVINQGRCGAQVVADETFASRTTLLKIVIFKGFYFLLDILDLHTSPIYKINNKSKLSSCFHEKINNLNKNHSCKIEMECHAKFSRSAKQIRKMVNVINKLWQLNVCCKTYCSTTIQ